MSNDSFEFKLQLWADRMRRFEQLKQTVADFCRVEHVSQASFYLWRRRVAEASSDELPQDRKNGTEKESPRFQSVVVTPHNAQGVTIRLPGGAVIELGQDATMIEHVVNQLLSHQATALEADGC